MHNPCGCQDINWLGFILLAGLCNGVNVVKNAPVRRRFWQRGVPAGIAFRGEDRCASALRFLGDKTWTDAAGARHSEQQIFDSAVEMIRHSRRLILLDFFLFNDFQGRQPECTRLLSGEFTDLLVSHKNAHPATRIVLITDPLNTVYGSLPSAQFERLRRAGIEVVITNLRKLRDPNPLYSIFWRIFVRPFGNSARGWLGSPLGGANKVTLRGYLEAMNFKANHRKTLITDNGDDWHALVTSANPHDASSAHTNIGMRFAGLAVRDLLATENAVLLMSASAPVEIVVEPQPAQSDATVQVLTESAIRDAALQMIDASQRNERLSVSTFYLSHRAIVAALKAAQHRGVALRLLLDPNKDAFGHPKFGIPNRQVAHELANEGVEIRWMHTHGEQCHTKMMLRETMAGKGELLAGSANLTRRNLDDFNLETSVLVRTDATAACFRDARLHFDLLWYGQPDRIFSVPYAHYCEHSRWKKWLYRVMEASGFSTW